MGAVPVRSGAEILYPLDTLRNDKPVYCPCGALDYVTKEAINAMQAAMFRTAKAQTKGENWGTSAPVLIRKQSITISFYWRPQGGSNPCCRRERAES